MGPSSSTCCPSCPSWRLTSPLLGQDPARFSARYLTGGSCFRGAAGGLWGRWGSSAGGGSCPSARWGPTWCPPSPSSTPLAGWGAFWPGAFGIPAPAGWWGDLSQALLAPNGVALVPVRLYEAAGCLLLFLPLDRLARRGGPGGSCRWSTCPSTGPSASCWSFSGGRGPGFWGPLSTSQWVALATLAVALPVLLWQRIPTKPPAAALRGRCWWFFVNFPEPHL